MRTLLLAAALLLVAPPVAAQTESSTLRTEGDLIYLDYEDMELTDVIKAMAKFTGKNFLYDERVRGRVTVISETGLKVEDAYRVFEAILQVKGFTTVKGPGGVLKIIPIRDAKEAPIDTVVGEGREPNRDLYITRLVSLKYVKADNIVNTFRPLVSKDANVIAYAPTNTMILTDTSANIRRLMTILAEIDVKTYQDQIKVIPVEYADAGQISSHLQSIFSEDGGSSAAARRRPTRARTQRGGQQQAEVTPSSFGAAGQPRFLTDERTNSIIVIAPKATIKQVERLITLLDYKRKGTGRLHVYRLQNADAEEMAATLSQLAGGGAGAAAGGAGGGQPAGGALLEGDVRITADAPTNSLIIRANAEGLSTIRDVIEELDTRRPQVMVEALIMEVNVKSAEDFGIGWVYNTLAKSENRVRSEFQGASETSNFLTRIIGKTVDLGLDAEGNMITAPLYDVLITAAQQDENADLISAPVILTADNEEAEIVVGTEHPDPDLARGHADQRRGRRRRELRRGAEHRAPRRGRDPARDPADQPGRQRAPRHLPGDQRGAGDHHRDGQQPGPRYDAAHGGEHRVRARRRVGRDRRHPHRQRRLLREQGAVPGRHPDPGLGLQVHQPRPAARSTC